MLTTIQGVMIAMTPTMTLMGHFNFSWLKVFTGGEMRHSTYTGPGELLLAPAALGDITVIRCNGNETWKVVQSAFLACTHGISKELKLQEDISKMLFTGAGFFVYHFSGSGIIWMTSFGAIIRKDVGIVAELHQDDSVAELNN